MLAWKRWDGYPQNFVVNKKLLFSLKAYKKLLISKTLINPTFYSCSNMNQEQPFEKWAIVLLNFPGLMAILNNG
jgi:hypothetical protein